MSVRATPPRRVRDGTPMPTGQPDRSGPLPAGPAGRLQAASGQGIEVLSVPAGRLALFLVLAGVIGVLAALWPAAARPACRS